MLANDLDGEGRLLAGRCVLTDEQIVLMVFYMEIKIMTPDEVRPLTVEKAFQANVEAPIEQTAGTDDSQQILDPSQVQSDGYKLGIALELEQ